MPHPPRSHPTATADKSKGRLSQASADVDVRERAVLVDDLLTAYVRRLIDNAPHLTPEMHCELLTLLSGPSPQDVATRAETP